MKSIGIVRRLDELGRVVLPKGVRTSLGIGVKDPIEILVDEDRIVLQKGSAPTCVFCGSEKDLFLHKEKQFCGGCRTALIAGKEGE